MRRTPARRVEVGAVAVFVGLLLSVWTLWNSDRD
jgi:hypothetical protein